MKVRGRMEVVLTLNKDCDFSLVPGDKEQSSAELNTLELISFTELRVHWRLRQGIPFEEQFPLQG